MLDALLLSRKVFRVLGKNLLRFLFLQNVNADDECSFLVRKTLNNNDHNQVFWARGTEHPKQTIVLTKTTGQQPASGHCCLRSSF